MSLIAAEFSQSNDEQHAAQHTVISAPATHNNKLKTVFCAQV